MLELIVHNSTYKPAEKKLEIVVAMVDYTLLDTVTTVTDQESGKVLSTVTDTQKRINRGFGETMYCPDQAGHIHDPMACAKANPEFQKAKDLMSARMSEWKTQSPAVDMTPVSKLIENPKLT